MTTRHPRLNFSTGILYEEEDNVPMIDNPLLRRNSSVIQLKREISSRDLIGDSKKVQTADDNLVNLILCKVNAGKAFATFNTIFGILIGILFFIKAAIDDGKLSWYGLWLRLGYFLLMVVDIHIMNPNPNVDTQTKWAYSVPHISGILLTGFQIVGGWGAYGEQCADFATCL
tara:strand:- start:107 stop:622 length:516 start_codon:yes stop_codon:yes gene_type:complete